MNCIKLGLALDRCKLGRLVDMEPAHTGDIYIPQKSEHRPGEDFRRLKNGTPGAIRTPDTLLRTEVFYPLNYRGIPVNPAHLVYHPDKLHNLLTARKPPLTMPIVSWRRELMIAIATSSRAISRI